MNLPTFELWLEFEHMQIAADAPSNMGWHAVAVLNKDGDLTPPGPWADETFFNMSITLADGKKYCLNVWTHKYFSRALIQDREDGNKLGGKYMLPPDLFVERADRQTVEEVVADLLRHSGLKDAWLCSTGEEGGD